MPRDVPEFWTRALTERRLVMASQALDDLGTVIDQLTALVARALSHRRLVLLFGNGGSAASAEHAAAEWVGRFNVERAGLPAIALASNVAAATAVSNDYGFEQLFARQVEALGNAGDVAIGLSTSGQSVNVARGLRAARRRGISTVALLGPALGRIGRTADLVVRAPGSSVAVIQEMHDIVLHVVADEVDRRILTRGARSRRSPRRRSNA